MSQRLSLFDSYDYPKDICNDLRGNKRRLSTKSGGRNGPRCRIISKAKNMIFVLKSRKTTSEK